MCARQESTREICITSNIYRFNYCEACLFSWGERFSAHRLIAHVLLILAVVLFCYRSLEGWSVSTSLCIRISRYSGSRGYAMEVAKVIEHITRPAAIAPSGLDLRIACSGLCWWRYASISLAIRSINTGATPWK